MNPEPPLLLSELSALEKELRYFNSNDLLVRFFPKDVHLFESGNIPLTPEISRLIQESKKKKQLHGYEVLSVVEGTIRANDGSYIPLFIHSLYPQENPVLNTVNWNLAEDEWMVNPHVLDFFPTSKESLISTEKSYVLEHLAALGVEVYPLDRYLGFFHPFRFALYREVVELKTKPDLHRLNYFFENSIPNEVQAQAEMLPLLFPSDQSQYEALQLGHQNSMVIQGPPGTGKSQVLSNLLGLLLKENQRVLVCSSKKEALEVLFHRLKSRSLEDLIFLRNGEHSAKSLLQALQQSWSILDQPSSVKHSITSTEAILAYDQNLRCYHKPGLIGRLSPREFIVQTGINPSEKGVFQAGLPSYDQWCNDQKYLNNFPPHVLRVLSQIAPDQVLHTSFESLIVQWTQALSLLSSLSLTHHDADSLSEYHRRCQAAYVFSGENYERFYELRTQEKRITKWKNLLENLTLKKAPLQEKLAAWRQIPTQEELEVLAETWGKNAFWERRKLRKQRAVWLRLASIDWRALINITLDYYRLTDQEKTYQQKLLALGFRNLNEDFTAYKSFLQLQQSSLFTLFESFNPGEVAMYREQFHALSKVVSIVNRTFQPAKFRDVKELMAGLITDAKAYIPYLKAWDQLHVRTKSALRHEQNLPNLQRAVIATEWNRFLAENPSMVGFFETTEVTLQGLAQRCEAAASSFAAQLKYQRNVKFDAFQRLLATPNHRLTAQERQEKTRLREGKRMLVKWFARKRGFPTVGEVLASPASDWVALFKPLWFTSPNFLPLDFSLSPGCFDAALVDEASQMPLAHSLGILYRCDRILVAGDLMQMPPSSYFSRGQGDRMSLLEHAAYHLPARSLKFHYRSRHAKLIAFSNSEFYQNELVVVPCFPDYEAITDTLLTNAQYQEGVNLQELQEVLRILQDRIHQHATSLGIVTFSERQLEALLVVLKQANQPKIWEYLENGKLFLKTLEQVQGDECDEMIISLGYAKNHLGKLDLRMGPLTQPGGEKRLNVLLTRAKFKLHVVRSLVASDFGVVNSQGLQVMKRWLVWLEQQSKGASHEVLLSNGLSGSQGKISLSRNADLADSILNLLAYRNLLKDRGWYVEETAFSSEPDHTRILPLDDIEQFA